MNQLKSQKQISPPAPKPRGSEPILWNLNKIALSLLAPILALVTVYVEPDLTHWMTERPATLPVILILLLASLIHPVSRQTLVITLCYGVSFLALRDAFQPKHINVLLHPIIVQFGNLDYKQNDLLETIVITTLMIIAALAALAAVGETAAPGSTWTRRCYFGAAALYFTGMGTNYLFARISMQSVVLALTGVTAIVGCLFANHIITGDQIEEEQSDIEDDIELHKQREEEHLKAVLAKEWHESALQK